MMNKLTIKDFPLKGKKVIVRVDFNVPLNDKLQITDDRRIQEALPTIRYILEQGAAKVILMSHLGRPNGKVTEGLRLKPIAVHLQKLLGQPLRRLDDCVGTAVKQSVDSATEKVILLENLRFYAEEEKNTPAFARQLADLADVYVNDAFGTAHRAHASTAGITQYLPALAGFLLEKELKYLGQAIHNPAKPFVVILGGAKVSDKILLVENLLPKANAILIGGGMAYTFCKAEGKSIGKSLLEADRIETAKNIMKKAKAAGVNIVLTEDFVVVEDFGKPQDKKVVTGNIPDGWEGIDIGPKTRQRFKDVLAKAKTVVWNGPVGVFEIDAYAQGTRDLAQYLTGLSGVTTIIGGGDTAAAISKFGLDEKMTHISTGGGASLELLEGKELPGIAALSEKKKAGKV
jgi:phosphoglycerate kinase